MKDVCREVERIDYYGGGVLLHSLSGGTGSGFSSKLCEEICDTFPAGHILIVSVAPHQIEESPVQHYNTLLSLASLQRSSLSQKWPSLPNNTKHKRNTKCLVLSQPSACIHKALVGLLI
uniref:Tubulin/FtsZ GTPase domain-containing protein n=1 Tax=Hucho hucho TaxID=62062 RepID=A0A4W5RVY0_9TELE